MTVAKLITSSYLVGRAFEQLALSCLTTRLKGLHLTNRGGPHDGGLDLEGRWDIPRGVATSHFTSFKVGVQCKDTNKKAGVEVVRELEASVRALSEQVKEPTLGMLVTRLGFTRYALRQCQNSQEAIAMLQLDEHGIHDVYLSRQTSVLIPPLRLTKQRRPHGGRKDKRFGSVDKPISEFVLMLNDTVVPSFERHLNTECV